MTTRRSMGAGVLGVLMPALACHPGAGTGSVPLPVPARTDAPEVLGTPDPSWTVSTLEGAHVRLGDLQGAPVFINLWATWCPPCVAEMASIERLAEAVRGSGVRFLLVSPEDEEPVRAFVARHDLGLPVAVEETLAPEEFGARALPTTVVLDARGRMVLVHRGAAQWDRPEVVAFLRALAEEGP